MESATLLNVRMNVHCRALRSGSTLIETILFLGIVAIMSTTITGVYISLQEARLRQQYVADTEQRGALILATMTKTIRNAENILEPAAAATGERLALQMGQNTTNPTIYLKTAAGNLTLIQKQTLGTLLGEHVTISGLTFTNVGGTNVALSFDLAVTMPTIPPALYTKHFEGTATLTPKDETNGGCPDCPLPTCSGGQYHWYVCSNGTCTAATGNVACT